MKLLVFCYEFPPLGGGAANALGYLSREWVRLGCQTTIVTSAGGGFRPGEYYREGLKIIRIGVGRKFVFRARISEMFRYMLRTFRMVPALYRSERPDLCVAFMTVPGGMAPSRLHAKYKVPFISCLRGGDVPGFGKTFLRPFHFISRGMIGRIWKQSRMVIANSEGLAALAKKREPSLDVRVIPNGVDTAVFFPKPEKKPGKVLELLFVGRFVNIQKNIALLIDAASQTEGVHLTLVGEGEDKPKICRQVAAGHLESRVRLTGWLKNQDLLSAYQNADVYVSASFWEGMSNTALEAMSCGLPLLLSDIPGHRELIWENKNGYLFNPHDLTALKPIILRLREDIHLRRLLGESSRARAADFDWQVLARRYFDCFRECEMNGKLCPAK